ncbi:S8 family serine peptidase [Geobacillus thermoleovorans]|uniref:S8 family serine peptidase n=1 Tax=Geobacillus thermoleovorans TaxID=33941 RepID=UPI000B2843AB|nr:hypothetical protein [Geobacillus thermoleovorans]
MKRRYRIWAAASAVVALLVAAAVLGRPAPEENAPAPPRLKPFDAEVAPTHPTVVALDSLSAGEQLKQQLNKHPRIREILHNRRGDRSHYFANEIVVRFRALPSESRLQQMEAAIAGQFIKQVDHVFVFRSREQTYEEMRRYFRSLPTVDYCEPHYIYMQNEWNKPAPCRTIRFTPATSGTCRPFIPKTAGRCRAASGMCLSPSSTAESI